MGIHDQHRKRVKTEFMEAGLQHWPEHKVLELLLFYALPQGDVNPLAHRLIEEFGSIAGVFDADAARLQAVKGIGPHAATLCKLIPQLCAFYMGSRASVEDIISHSYDIHRLLAPYFYGHRNEMSYLVALDGKQKLLGVRKISEGTPAATEITARQVAEAALSYHATKIILAHSHGSGIALPSDSDLITTSYLQDFLGKMGVSLIDHVIFADEDMISLRDSGYMR